MLSTKLCTSLKILSILSCVYFVVNGTELLIDEENVLVWCTVNFEEQVKCKNLSRAIERDFFQFGRDKMTLRCDIGLNKFECMNKLDTESAHITTLDPGEVFVGGRYHSLVPIMQEINEDSSINDYAVAVIKKGSLPDVKSIQDLRKKKACFAGVGTIAGWVIPIYTLMKEGGLEIIDCNNHVKSTINFFGPSCAVNSLINKFNPVGDNSDQLCQLCAGKSPGQKCTEADPYAGYEGAFRCLVEAGDIAFLLHTTVHIMTSSGSDLISVKENDFELLCKDGTRRPIREYRSCNWGMVPTHAIVTTSAKSVSLRQKYHRFLKKAIELYGSSPTNRSTTSLPRDFNEPLYTTDSRNSIPRVSGFSKPDDEEFQIFQSAPRYGTRRSLLFQDTARGVMLLPESQQTYKGYLKENLKLVLGVYDCPVGRMTLCVTSDPELEKCVKMKDALRAQLLKPEMNCLKAKGQNSCMQLIQRGVADVAVLDAGDVYTAGLNYDLIPFLAEVYNLGGPEYYVVAVAKEEDPDTELTYLKGKNTCHSGMQLAAGWVIPMAFLISNGWIRSYGCDSIHAAAEYFTKSCIPGSLSPEYNTGVPDGNLCHLCHGTSKNYCQRDASEDYFGDTGAFRCLVEGGGDVAFMKHTTVMENTDGKRTEWWARNTLTNDFQLLCTDGRRESVQNYAHCNLGKVKANAIVTRGGRGYNETELNAFTNLFIYAQQFYGRKHHDEWSFSMFYSKPPYADLIFQDATLQLHVLKESERNFRSYLGRSFMRARSYVDCHAGAQAASGSFILALISSLIIVLLPSLL